MDKELRPEIPRKIGPKLEILEAYKKRNNKEDAYKALKCLNERIGLEAFSKENVDEWIAEYEKSRSRTDEDFTR